MKKIERLNWIIMTLRQRGRMSATQLAEYMEVSHRTIYRDMDALSQMKVPLVAHEGLHGGYEIEEGYFLPTVRLTEKEILILMLLMKFSEELNMGDLSVDIGALRGKLLEICKGDTAFLDGVLSRLHFDVDLIQPDPYAEGVFTTLLQAFAEEKRVELTYFSPHRNELSTRRVSLLNLFFADGCWYLAGYCHEKTEKRTFRLDRIRHLEQTEEPVDFKILKDYDNYAFSSPKQNIELLMEANLYEVVRSDRAMLDAVVEQVADNQVTVNQVADDHMPKNSLKITLSSNRLGYFERLAFENVDRVTVLGPETLVQSLKEKFKAGSKKYF